jgi:4'-phosphopantetheinyl transferase
LAEIQLESNLKEPSATITWPARSDSPRLAGDEIHVWAATLASPELDRLAATLSSDERDRAARFKFDKHRNRFTVGRGTLREVLAHYLKIDPSALRFGYSTNGKPELESEFASAGIHFNLAHSEDLALIAITKIGPVGVDVECVRPVNNVDELVARFFSPREDALFQKVPEPEKPAAFFNLWTRKEALLKATGEGITRSLSLVEVSFLPGEPARLLAVSGDLAKAAAWGLRELSPAAGFAGAVAIHAQDFNVQCNRWGT